MSNFVRGILTAPFQALSERRWAAKAQNARDGAMEAWIPFLKTKLFNLENLPDNASEKRREIVREIINQANSANRIDMGKREAINWYSDLFGQRNAERMAAQIIKAGWVESFTDLAESFHEERLSEKPYVSVALPPYLFLEAARSLQAQIAKEPRKRSQMDDLKRLYHRIYRPSEEDNSWKAHFAYALTPPASETPAPALS